MIPCVCEFIPSLRSVNICKTCGRTFDDHRDMPIWRPLPKQRKRKRTGRNLFTTEETEAIALRCIARRGQTRIEAEAYGVHRNTIHNLIFRYRAAQRANP